MVGFEDRLLTGAPWRNLLLLARVLGWHPVTLIALAMKYKVALRKAEEGYSVSCPGLPGCWSQGDTEEEALDNIADAIKEYLAAVEETVKDADMREVDIAA